MGLRRTPPPGMALPARQPSAPPPEFLSEFPPTPEQPQAETPAPARNIPPTRAIPVKASPINQASPTPSPQLPPPKPPATKLPRVTPRNSLAGPSSPAGTPQQQLINLAKVVNRPPATPQRPTNAGGGGPSVRRSVRRTPGAGRLAAKLTARSPHAARAFERRAVTPGRERRKSGRYPPARATPRDLLRALSRQLAPTSVPFEPTPLPTPVPASRKRSTLGPDRRASDVMFYSDPGHEEEEEDEDEFPPAPILSMNLEELDQSLDDIRPMREPRFSVPLEDLDNTHHSVEFGRREAPLGRRPSFEIELDDRFTDLDALRGAEEDVRDETVVIADDSVMVGEDIAIGDETEDEEEERMGFVGDEEEDVTMGQGELQFDEGDSYFLPIPPGGLDLDEDEDDSRTLELNGNYDDDPVRFDEDDLDLEETSAEQAGTRGPQPLNASNKTKSKRKPLPLSRHGHPVPQFPRATIKKMAQTFTGGANISNETLSAIVAASEAYFEQVSDDLATYAKHAGRKTIEDGDVVMLLKRQRQITANKTAFSLAQRHLPRELLQEVRMPLMKPTRAKKRSKQVLEDVEEGEEA